MYLLKRNENTSSHKDLYTNVQSNIDSEKVETM